MPPTLTARETIRVGKPIAIEAPAPEPPFMAVFEDDGDTGYLYGLDTTREGNPIVDALHIYDARAVTDRKKPSVIEIVWSSDSSKCFLFINRYPHAAFDFAAKRGYCRTNFPPPIADWSAHSHDWDESVMALLQ